MIEVLTDPNICIDTEYWPITIQKCMMAYLVEINQLKVTLQIDMEMNEKWSSFINYSQKNSHDSLNNTGMVQKIQILGLLEDNLNVMCHHDSLYVQLCILLKYDLNSQDGLELLNCCAKSLQLILQHLSAIKTSKSTHPE